MFTVTTATRHQLPAALETGMFRLRAQTFSARLGWDVKTTPDGLEIDEFDACPGVTYITATEPTQGVVACWRLLPTLGPNMLRDTFPELLHGQPSPAAADVWELSRFAVDTDKVRNATHACDAATAEFGSLTVEVMAESVRFARANGIARYVTVTTTAIERLLKRQGVSIYRVGPPLRIGQVMTVASFIEIDDQTAHALGV